MNYLVYYLIGINTFTFVLFGWDKWMAYSSAWRTPEIVLWLLSLLGGSAGALLGMHVFRHKTKKTSFQFILAIILFIHIAGIAGYVYFFRVCCAPPI